MKTFTFANPEWTQEKYMKSIGYQLISDNYEYAKYENIAGHDFPHYGKAGRGKRIVWFNRGLKPEAGIFMAVGEDGGTRQVYHGVIENAEQMDLILRTVM